MAITYAFICGNEKKAVEYQAQMARYGRSTVILPQIDDAAEQNALIEAYLSTAAVKDRFVLREFSDLYNADLWEQGKEVISGKDLQNERVYNVAKLEVFHHNENGVLQQKHYEALIEGRVDLTKRALDGDPYWWDDIFVTERSKNSYLQERDLFGKTSARQQVIGQFICDHVLFDRLVDVTFNPHNPSQAVDFSPEFSPASVLRNNKFIQLASLDQSRWGLGNLLKAAVRDGIFFRSADSRRSGNYFCPPISGIPRIKRPDPFWETTFQIHDFFHQIIPDQLFTGDNSVSFTEQKNVYTAARLMSEAFTIVLADMLFVEEIKKAGFVYDYSVRKINPLFGSLNLKEETPIEQLKTLLRANTALANLGDYSYYEALLKEDGKTALTEYAETYTHFFVPDLIWSADNFDNMQARKEQFAAWIALLGRDLFVRAKLPLLDELTVSLKEAGADLSTYEGAVGPVFEHLFHKVLEPALTTSVSFSDEEALSNAFLRYMMGQTFLYSAYRHVNGMDERGRILATILRETKFFGAEEIKSIRDYYNDDLATLKKAGYITGDDCTTYSQIFPLFSPHFLSYDFDRAIHRSIPEAVKAVFADQQSHRRQV